MRTAKIFWLIKERGNIYVTEEKVDKITSLTPHISGTLNALIVDHCGQMRGFKNGMSREITVTIEA